MTSVHSAERATDALGDRKRHVPRDFDRVAARYDRMTGMNPGYHKHLRWSAERLAAPPGARLLDLCCGTGLSTAALAATVPGARIDALDASAGMLSVARRKRWPGVQVRFTQGDAMDVRAAGLDGPYDAILMAYGIRNMPDMDACLTQLLGLLRPGGRLCLHEYSVADSKAATLIWKVVTTGIIVPAGLLTSGTADIYRYLRRSVLAFPGVADFERRLRAHGFDDVHTMPMDGWQRDIVHSFLARRPLPDGPTSGADAGRDEEVDA